MKNNLTRHALAPHRRLLPLVLTAALGSSLMLSACAGSEDAASPLAGKKATLIKADDPNAPVEITIYTGQTENYAKALNEKAAQFKQKHPNVTVRMIQGAASADQLLEKLTSAFAADKYPNAAYTFGSWATELEQSGHALDISENVKLPEANWMGFNEAMRNTASPNGRTIAFPAVADALTLFYNKTIFDQLKLPYPTPKTTWAEFRELAKKIRNPATSTYGTAVSVANDESGTWQMWPQLWQEGGEILSKDKKKATFNSEAGQRVLNYWRDMAQSDKTVYLDQADKRAQLFGSGKIGMLIAGPWIAADMVAAKVNYGVTSLPNTNGNNETVAGIDNWALFDKKDNNQNYWTYKFFEWMTSAEIDPGLSIPNGHMPLRASGERSADFAKAAKEIPGYKEMAENLANNVKHERPIVNGYVELSSAYSAAVSKILQGKAETKQALDQAAEKADRALNGK